MNFYDIYTTLTINPDEGTQQAMTSICEYCGCLNQLEALKKALWKKPNRVENPGAFPFSEETGKIYDALWKAAQSENYGTAEKIGRFFMRLICPPAEDEGMGKFHARYHEAPEDPNAAPSKPTPQKSYSRAPETKPRNEEPIQSVGAEPVQQDNNDDAWEVDDDSTTVVSVSKPANDIVRRGGDKKKD